MTAVAALLLATAGCGGGDEEAAATEPATEARTAVGTTGGAETATGGAGGSAAPDLADEECRELAGLGARVSQALGGAAGGDLEATREYLDRLAADAPEEIRDDVEAIAAAYGTMAEAMAGVDVSEGAQPDPEALAELERLASELDQDRLQQANENITAWVDEHCGATGGGAYE